MKFKVAFADFAIKEKLARLEHSTSEDKMILAAVHKAIDHLSDNAYSGVRIQRHLIPRTYLKRFHVANLWKYDLPDGWRLIYFVIVDGDVIISVIVDWMSHKEYDRLFHY